VRFLTVLYDARCGLCSSARRWLEGQPQIVPLELLAADSEEARRRFPTLAEAEPEELVAVSDEGDVYRGPQAWIVCLWALEDYREWSFRFARPALLPLVRELVEWLSTRRHRLSRALRMGSDAEIAAAFAAAGRCESGRCEPREGRTR
jgi:predicted DCC family thiol-disulfide oxidoreductase YuxK